MSKYAAIDIGTNAIKFHIAEKNEDGNWQTIIDKAEVTRLGEGLNKTGKIKVTAMERNFNAIGELVKLAHQEGVREIIAVGTMALRTASNANYFVETVRKKYGLSIKIISGEEEARLSFLAVNASLDLSKGKFVIFDIGGGSTEFIFGKNSSIEQRFSLDLGVVRLTEDILRSDPVTEHEFLLANEIIVKALEGIFTGSQVHQLIGVGATLTTLGAIKQKMRRYNPDVIHGSKLSLSDVKHLVLQLKARTVAERKKIIGLEPRRADVILAGAMIVQLTMEKTAMSVVTISDKGVRHGVLIERFGYH